MVRKNNQDYILLDDDLKIYVVCDGMGGHAGGEVASRLCAEELHFLLQDEKIRNLCENHKWFLLKDEVVNCFRDVCLKIFKQSLQNPDLLGMGTTCSLILFCDEKAFIFHVGDSRIYLIRNNFIYQLTRDHTWEEKVSLWSDKRFLSSELSRYQHFITRAMGLQESEKVDSQMIACEAGDFFMLCSDGLYNKVCDKDISNVVTELGVEAPRELVAMANHLGSDDNVSSIVVRYSV